MIRFTIRRLLQVIPTIIAVALLIFIIFSVVPGSFAASLIADGRSNNNPELVEQLNREFGLDQPMYVRFFTYLGDLAQFDLGTSFRSREPVTHVIGARIGASLNLSMAAMGFAVVFGVPLGFLAALKPGSFLGYGDDDRRGVGAFDAAVLAWACC